MKDINLLFLAPHWRVSLIQAFQQSWKRSSLSGKLIGADSDPYAAGQKALEQFYQIPQFEHLDCKQSLLEICKVESVDAILPLTNKAIEFLDNHRESFSNNNCRLYIQSSETIQVCHDKLLLFNYLKKIGLKTPHSFSLKNLPASLSFPLVLKDRKGEGGKNVTIIKNSEEFDFYKKSVNEEIFQEKLEGQEFSVDWYSNLEGKPLIIVPRERIKVRSGEVMQSKIQLKEEIIDAVSLVGKYLNLKGPCTLQGFLSESGDFFFTDINLRFGSGYVHTLAAGGDVPLMMYRELSGEESTNASIKIKEGSIMTRFLDAFFIQ